MPISVQCGQCGKSLKVPDTMAGKRGKCPCGNVVTIPMNGAVQSAPSAPMRQPDFASSGPARAGKGGGSVTRPEVFKKLFMGTMLSLLVTIGAFFLAIVIGIVFIGSVASSAGDAFDAQMKHAQKMQQYQSDVMMWEMNGKRGPKPVEPPPPAAPKSSGGSAIGFLVPVMYGFAMLGYLGVLVFGCIFLYKAWDLIQDGNPRTTPGKAVGFMFIPFFNIYWQFIALMGLCDDLNKYSDSRGISARPTSPNMMMAALILNLVGCSMVGVILEFICFNQAKNACMDIAQAKLA